MGCGGQSRPVEAWVGRVSCAALDARMERGEGPSNSRSFTYDAHARIDTSAVAMTEVKGCIVLKMVAAFSSKRGGAPPTLLDAALRADSFNPIEPPSVEWKTDGWRRVFEYQVTTGAMFRLTSRGPDGIANTNDDVTFVPE